jgi:hypothetical protein
MWETKIKPPASSEDLTWGKEKRQTLCYSHGRSTKRTNPFPLTFFLAALIHSLLKHLLFPLPLPLSNNVSLEIKFPTHEIWIHFHITAEAFAFFAVKINEINFN